MSEPIIVAPPPKYRAVKHNVEFWTAHAMDCYVRPGAAEVRETLVKSLGVSVESLERLGVGVGFDQYRNLFYSTWPERRQGGKVVGIVRRYAQPINDGGNKLHMKGGKPGLYLPLDWWKSSGPILIPEGGSDVAALVTMGVIAIGRPSNVGGVNLLIGVLAQSEQLHRPIIIIGERDFKPNRVGSPGCKGKTCDGCPQCWPGKYGARVTAERLKESLPRKARIFWSLVPDGFKDSREWLNKAELPTAARFLNRMQLR